MHPHPSPIPTSAARRSTHVAPVLALLTAASLAIAPHSVRAQTVGTSSGTAGTMTDATARTGFDCYHEFLSQPAGSTSCTSFDTSPTLATASSGGTNALRTVRSQASSATTGSNEPYGDAQASQWAKLSVTGSDPSAHSLVFHFATDAMTSLTSGSQLSYGFWGLFLSTTQQGTEKLEGVYTTQHSNGTVDQSLNADVHRNSTGTEYDFTMPFAGLAGDINYSFESHSITDVFLEGSGQSSLTATLAGIDAVNDQGQTIGTAVFGDDGNGTLVLTTPTTTAPEPITLALVATGLVGMVPVARRKRR